MGWTIVHQCYHTVGWVIWPLKWPTVCRVGCWTLLYRTAPRKTSTQLSQQLSELCLTVCKTFRCRLVNATAMFVSLFVCLSVWLSVAWSAYWQPRRGRHQGWPLWFLPRDKLSPTKKLCPPHEICAAATEQQLLWLPPRVFHMFPPGEKLFHKKFMHVVGAYLHP